MEWFESWFDTPYYHILYSNRDYTEAEIFIKKLMNILQLPKGDKVIDLACGKGRHSIFLSKMGYQVLGLDLSQQSIAHNKRFESPSLHFQVHDMRCALPTSDADAVLNLFTSFGYFQTEEEDLRVFTSVHQGLKTGGVFILDYLNKGFVEQDFKENSTEKRGGILFHIHKKIEDHYVVKTINFSDAGQDFEFTERVKLHTPEQINQYAKSTGFERIKVWGDYHLNEFNQHSSPRCINYFVKK